MNKTSIIAYAKLGVILIVIVVFFVWLGIYLINKKGDEITFIKKDYTVSKGIITKIKLYKGKSVTIKYIVKGKIYIESDGIDRKLHKNVGDSILIKISNKNPELMVSEYNWNY